MVNRIQRPWKESHTSDIINSPPAPKYTTHFSFLRARNDNLTVSGIVHAVINIATGWVTPPRWEWSRDTTGACNGKGEQEDHDLGSTVQRGGDEVVPLDEFQWLVLSEVELSEEADDEVDPDGRVDTNNEVSKVPEDDGKIQVAEDLLLGPDLGGEVKGKRDKGTN